MAPLKQPRDLLWSAMTAASEMIITRIALSSGPDEEDHLKDLVQMNIPPPLLGDILAYAVKRLSVYHKQDTQPHTISSLLNVLLHPRLTEIKLSDLSYLGSVDMSWLDELESTLIQVLPAMKDLVHVDISTNRNHITLPSCSAAVLRCLGQSCPKLEVLDLNNNNRINGESLYELYPTSYNIGCINLEKIYIQDCSVEPEDVAMLIHSFPNLKLIGYKELGRALYLLKTRRKMFGRKKKAAPYRLMLTHVDNSLSRIERSDGEILEFISQSCPDLTNLKARVTDEDVIHLKDLKNLQHLELRYYTGTHHHIGHQTHKFFRSYECQKLTSLTIFCNILFSRHVEIIANNCSNLNKLFLHANNCALDSQLQNSQQRNYLEKLEVFNIRVGCDELIMSPIACDVAVYLLKKANLIQEIYLLIRTDRINHEFIASLIIENKFYNLRILICDAPRRTLAAPMLALTLETAYLLMDNCPSLNMLGNLIAWHITDDQLTELNHSIKELNYDLTIISSKANKLNSKYF
ncbi:unnamed protein product [Meganyctiphanes norvegica]|uniref:Uncharacterized protein n=1 Tax=Meganyctiphanes norvegica TaxID=48144 RepID=A0AAV2SM15_MEGNR